LSIVCTSFPPPRTSPSQAGVFKGRQETSWKRMLMKARRSVDTALPCVKRRHTSRHVIIRNRARNFTHKCSIWQRPTLRKLGPTTDHWRHACYFVHGLLIFPALPPFWALPFVEVLFLLGGCFSFDLRISYSTIISISGSV